MDLTRSNKITAYWTGEGVAIGVFYKTHTKLLEKKSNDADVIAAGFVMPEGTEQEPANAQDKLAAFKNFLQVNASMFGIMYDPIDRRDDKFKFPNSYNNDTFADYSQQMATRSIEETLDKVQKNVIDNMVKGGHIPAGTEIAFGIERKDIEIKELYSNGNIKYADAKYGVKLQVGEKVAETTCTVSAVSGQLKRPRELADGVVITQSGIKGFLIENGLLPKIEKPVKEKKEDTDADGANAMPTADDGEAESAQAGDRRRRSSSKEVASEQAEEVIG